VRCEQAPFYAEAGSQCEPVRALQWQSKQPCSAQVPHACSTLTPQSHPGAMYPDCGIFSGDTRLLCRIAELAILQVHNQQRMFILLKTRAEVE